MTISAEFVEETLQKYITSEENLIKELDGDCFGVDLSDFEKERIKTTHERRIDLLKNIHFDLLE